MTRSRAVGFLLALVIAGAGFADYQVFRLSSRVGAESAQALTLARAIQAQRIDFIRQDCEQQNARHRQTILALDGILRRAEHVAPRQKAQIEESRAPTVLMIDQLAPLQDCRSLLFRLQASP